MKELELDLLLVLFCLLVISSNFSTSRPGVIGSFISDTAYPIGATFDINASEHSSSGAYSVLGLISWGDASITGARELEPGGKPRLGRVSHIDIYSVDFFGISYCKTTAHGLLP